MAVAERERDAGPEREARILAGLWGADGERSEVAGWTLPDQRAVLEADIELNAQGLTIGWTRFELAAKIQVVGQVAMDGVEPGLINRIRWWVALTPIQTMGRGRRT